MNRKIIKLPQKDYIEKLESIPERQRFSMADINTYGTDNVFNSSEDSVVYSMLPLGQG